MNHLPFTPLCGACIDGYSEIFASSACQLCEANDYTYLIMVFLVSILFMLGSVWVDNSKKEVNIKAYVLTIYMD